MSRSDSRSAADTRSRAQRRRGRTALSARSCDLPGWPRTVEAARDATQALANFSGHFGERPTRCVELLHGIDEPKHGDTVVTLEEDDVARQEQTGARVELHGFECECWIAGAENPVATKVDPELGLESLLEV